jgi:hypothetical protein
VGPGIGAECTICRTPVTPDQIEYEIEFARNGDTPGRDTYRLHSHCFTAWTFERDGAGPPPAGPSTR